MKTLKIAILGAALFSPATTFAAYEPTSAGERIKGLSTLIQDVEGYPNPVAHGSCTLVSRAVNDVHGKFIGYHTFYVCS